MAKKSSHKRTLFVYADWPELGSPQLMGNLYSERLRGKEIFSFEYTESWLQSDNVQVLDPNLQHYRGIQYLGNEQDNFGIFLDSSPDRWGRVLMRRREAALARKEDRQESLLFETDYLLGVFDGHRMGALRFKLAEDDVFLNNNIHEASPPWTSLRELEEISLKLEDDNIMDNPEYIKWLSMLVSPGSSLGGARPKASIIDNDKELWIAKFPSKNDNGDVGGWEIVTYELAKKAGIIMAESKAQRFSSTYYTFLTKRFDRKPTGKRIHFASAMTMLGHTDGHNYSEGASYLKIVEFIQKNGADVEADLKQLWRRIVFSMCVSNTDDHLRNHGFLLTPMGWKLSPAYDINPSDNAVGLKLNVSENDNSLDLELALEVAQYFRLSKTEANQIIEKVKNAVASWNTVANKYGISRREQELKSVIFNRFI